MKKVLIVLALICLVPFVISCVAPQEAVKGTGKGTADIIGGAAEGVMEAGKGVGGAVGGTVQATGEALIGRGEEASEYGKVAVESLGEGVIGVVEKPIEGLAKGLKEIDRGIKEATGSEEIK